MTTGRAPPEHGARSTAPRPDEAALAALADRLCHKLVALESDELRARAAAEELTRLDPPSFVSFIGRLVRLARSRSSAADVVAAISRALAQNRFDPEFIATCLGLARSRADRLAEVVFASGPALRVYEANDELFIDRRLQALPLGQRRALSRTRDIDMLIRLAQDQDPRVIRALLQNPRVTEREAVITASRRPTHARVLEEVLASRFGLSRRVRRAVAHNPYASVALAARACTTLTLPELRELADDDKLSAEVRRHARSLIVARRSTPAERGATPARTTPAQGADLELLLALTPSDADAEIVVLRPDGSPLDR